MQYGVLHIYKDYYPPVYGGIEKTVSLLARGVRDEYDVRVLVTNRRLKTEIEHADGIEVIKVGSLGRFVSAPLSPRFPSMLRRYDADILHFHCPNPTGDIAYFLAKPRGKVVITYHSDVVRQWWAMSVYGPILRRFLQRADAILPTSPNYIRSSPYLSKVAEKCHVVPLGVPIESYARTAEREAAAHRIRRSFQGELIVFVGKLRYYKGLHFLLQAMKEIRAHLLIIGSGPERDALAAMCRRFGIEEKVTFLGELSDEEVVRHLHAADIFCLPSHLRSEAYGICQIEAMACGLPVVSTNLDTGVPFVNQHEVTGLVVPPASARHLVEAIELLLKNEQLRREMGRRAQQRAIQEFNSSLMVQRVKEIYKKVLGR
jgi:glycosyltransferase involved in cell wall biosynthesis